MLSNQIIMVEKEDKRNAGAPQKNKGGLLLRETLWGVLGPRGENFMTNLPKSRSQGGTRNRRGDQKARAMLSAGRIAKKKISWR